MVGFLLGIGIFYVALIVFFIVVRWKIYQKAGYQGWESIIPIYSYIVMLKIVGKPWWWIFMWIVPVANIVFGIWAINMLSKSFGKDEGFTVGLILLSFIFFPILAFGDAQYQGPYGDPEAFAQYQNRGKSFDFEDKQLYS